MSNHSSYGKIEDHAMGNEEALASGQAITFGGNGAKGRDGGRGTLGFFGADLGSGRPTEGRVPAFLGLAERTGGVYVENPPTVADALRETGLDFDVRHNPVSASRMEEVAVPDEEHGLRMEERPTGELLTLPDLAATVAYPRDGGQPFALGVTSKRYAIVQNDEALSVGDALSEGRLVALGAYGRPVGAKVYAAYELGEGMSIGGGDPYRNFITITTSHDGGGSLVALLAPIRLGCTNQTYATFGRKATPRYSMRHVGRPEAKVEEARRVLGLAQTYLDVFKEECEELLSRSMSTDAFVAYAERLWGVKRDEEGKVTKRSQALADTRLEHLTTILASDTCEFGRGTAYAGYQAVVEYLDFFGVVRGGDDPQARRQERIMAGELDSAKDRAWQLATA